MYGFKMQEGSRELSRGKSRIAIRAYSVCILTGCVLLQGCLSEQDKTEIQAVKLVTQDLAWAPDEPKGDLQILAGEVEDGVGVVMIVGRPPLAKLSRLAKIFWVRDGVAYYVNAAARDLAPDLQQAPDNLEPEAVLKLLY